MAITFDDIAREAGVSRATVSRVVNGNVTVQAKTKKRICDTIERLGYTPPKVRRGPKPRTQGSERQKGAIALIAVGGASVVLAHPTTAAVVDALQKSCQERGYGLMLDQMTDPGQLPFAVESGQIRAAIIMGAGARYPSEKSERARACVRELAKHLPCALMFSPGHSVPSVDHFTGNDIAMGAYAFRALREGGAEAFAMVYPETYFHEAYLIRGRSFSDRAALDGTPALQCFQSGSEIRPEQHFPEPRYTFDGFDALAAHLDKQSKQRPIGVFLPLDDPAAALHRALAERKLLDSGRVRLAVALTSETNIRALDPAPIAIDFSLSTMTRQLIERLIQRQNNPDLTPTTFLTTPRVSS